ncbi:MAG: 3'-5' exoribonuclease, partial [Elusimicrobia bacterium]|nr:3'-5' exoribonuclease [Elusimicrobiota bacterium]
MPSLLGSFPDMDKAVGIINDTVDKGEKIAIITDSDVDGLSSLLILDDALRDANTSLFVCGGPAHGINPPDIKAVLESNPKVVITADVGISEHEASRAFRERGIKFIVTDHHYPCGKTAPADAVIDSCLANPSAEIAGCAAAFCLGASYKLSQKKDFNKIKIACDIETTGLSPSQNEIIEIGAVKFSGLKIIARFSSLLKPSSHISSEISALTGISNLELEGAPGRVGVLREFRKWIGDDTLIFHNAPFDKSFIDAEFRKYLGYSLINNTIDTLPMSRRALPSQSHKLDNLKDFFGITAVAHRALPDAEVAGKLYMILTHFESPAFKIFSEQNLPVAALGTLSDNIALKGISRALVKKHLSGILNVRRYSLRTLLKKLDISKKNLRRDLTLKLIPFLNTPKRMGKPALALDILKADSKKDFSAAMGRVKELNDIRQNKMRIAFAEILTRIHGDGLIKNPVIMLKAEKLPEGLRGPAASRISQMFGKPSVVFTRPANADFWTASARGAGHDMLKAFGICAGGAEFGGHPGACGIRINSAKLDKFIEDCGYYFKKKNARKTPPAPPSGVTPEKNVRRGGLSFSSGADVIW